MTPDERSLLERTAALAAENNKILRSIRRSTHISTAMSIFYWVIIIGLSVGAYYYIQPWITDMIGVLNKANNIQSNVTAAQGATDQLKSLLEKMQVNK